VEEKDCDATEKAVHEVNSATYCFDTQLLLNALQSITNQNAQGEYYLTDCIDILRREGNRIAAYCVNDASEILGVNDRVQLAQVEHIFRQNIRVQHMRNGVTLVDPASIYIDTEVSIGADSVLLPGTILRGKTVIGSACEIGPNTEITDCQVGDETIITHSVLVESSIGDQVNMGPFAYIRPGSKIQNQAKIGDFVEVKNSTIGQGSKVPHLSYIGDADIGSGTNIGCGTITVNYDGISKHRTHVGNNAFIGCNSNLVAPVTVGDRAYIAAGSTITDNVPDGALGIARQRQATKEGYTEKLEARLRERRPQK
jgi:bifunctional UDP-N-acetylglucosamine pyrophosphorylase/glucosamine-1-phosphate N-acetyltransferase